MWPTWSLFEPSIRGAAGLGRANKGADPDWYAHRYVHCDVLVVGAGPAGLSAALAASRAGARVILADEQIEPGGSLLWRQSDIKGKSGEAFAHDSLDEIRDGDAKILTRTQATGYYDQNYITLTERVVRNEPSKAPRYRLWFVRAKQVVLATGAMERPLVFPHNDRPGIMLASAAQEYRHRYGVGVGRNAIVVTNNDSGLRAALDLHSHGVPVNEVIESRSSVDNALAAQLQTVGIGLRTASVITKTLGRGRVRAVDVADLSGGGKNRLACDAVLMAGGWTPTAHLYSQAGGKLAFDDTLLCFRPDKSFQKVTVAGAANGDFGLDAALTGGWSAGRIAAEQAGHSGSIGAAPSTDAETVAFNIEPLWQVPSELAEGRQWVDFQNDVTSKDVGLAAREGYRSVEHLKRYTTTGMATDQGKTSNVNALALLADATGRAIPDVGTTTFRPPYTPLTFGAIVGPYRHERARPYRYLPTHEQQEKLGAIFMEAGGWLRPDYYPQAGEDMEAAVLREMRAVRDEVALFEASPLGKIVVKGPDAGKFLDLIYVNRASTLKQGRVRYGMMASEHGIVTDDGVFARLDDNTFLLGPSSGMVSHVYDAMREWLLCEWMSMDVTVQNITTQWATIALAGPKSRDVLTAAGTDIDLAADAFPHMHFRDGQVAGVPARIMRVSFTGELQYEINVPAGYGPHLWQALAQAGSSQNIGPVGIEAWMRLRTEKGYLHIGADTDGTTTPSDLGFNMWRKKTEEFVGRRSLMRPDMERNDRYQFVGFRGEDPALRLPVGAHIIPSADASIPCEFQGRITSSCVSPSLGQSVALGLIARGTERKGETVTAYFQGQRYQVEIVDPTHYDPEGERLHG